MSPRFNSGTEVILTPVIEPASAEGTTDIQRYLSEYCTVISQDFFLNNRISHMYIVIEN